MAVPPAVGRPQKSADMVQTFRFLGSGSNLPSEFLMGTLGPLAIDANLQQHTPFREKANGRSVSACRLQWLYHRQWAGPKRQPSCCTPSGSWASPAALRLLMVPLGPLAVAANLQHHTCLLQKEVNKLR